MAANPRSHEARAIHSDLELEFKVRGAEPPYALVPEEFEQYMSFVREIIDELKRDPDKFEEIGRGLVVDINTFKSARDKSRS
jgi:hypothetical protein